MKRFIGLLLSVLMLLTAVSMPLSSSAAEDEIKEAALNTEITESFSKKDIRADNDKNLYYDIYVFDVPFDGKITLTVHSECKGYFNQYTTYIVAPADSKDNRVWSPSNENFSGKWTIKLKKGEYIFAAAYKKNKKNDALNGEYTFKLAYKTTLPSTTLKSLTAQEAGFTAQWSKVKGVSGYQLQYSRKKDFSDATTLTVKKAKRVKTTVEELKRRKRYYVRVRPFFVLKNEAGKKNYYGKWTAAKKVKTQ